MYEYHGWATIIITTAEDPDNEEELIAKAVIAIEFELKNIEKINLTGIGTISLYSQ